MGKNVLSFDSIKIKQKTEEKLTEIRDVSGKDVAIIGMDVLMPLAKNKDEFWENIIAGTECVGSIPERRKKDIEKYMRFKDQDSDRLKYINYAFLDDIDMFDYGFFKFSPREAGLMNPVHRLFLQSAWHAMEDAGYNADKMNGSLTGVYAGLISGLEDYKYKQIINDVCPSMMPVAVSGNLSSSIPGRVSYMLNLRGPSMIVDTACSSSLAALHLACEAIRKGDCEMAFAGSVRVAILPFENENEKIGIESSDYLTRAFDENSDGTGFGEGIATVLLKPLYRAVKDKDHIYAVIKSSAMNQDGASMGLTAPNPKAQEEVILKAWEEAGIDPETISYIEVHGTGTILGDDIEVEGLKGAFKRYTDKRQICAISSVKSNIGHLYDAAGLAGLVKAVLAVGHKRIPGGINFNRPNRKIDFCESPVYVNTSLRKWETPGHPRRCGVSSFGLSGTNCHVILEEAPEAIPEENTGNKLNVLAISAVSLDSLKRLADDYLMFLKNKKDLRASDVCHTANTGRGHYYYRAAVTGLDIDEISDKLRRLTECDFNCNEENMFFGYHRKVNGDKGPDDENTILEKEKTLLSCAASNMLNEFVLNGSSDSGLLGQILKLYVSGADIEWNKLYTGNERRISLPLYPFEKSRCWVDIPGIKNDEKERINWFYNLGWKKEKNSAPKVRKDGAVLYFRDSSGVCEELSGRLKEDGRKVYEVFWGEGYLKNSDLEYAAGKNEEDYDNLLSQIKEDIVQIVHAFTLNGKDCPESIKELEEIQEKGVYSLFYLSRALIRKGLNNEVDVVLLSKYANEVTGTESILKPENALLYGMGKVIGREQPKILCRFIDIDCETGMENIFDEIACRREVYGTSYRNGERYVEEFREAGLDDIKSCDTGIKRDGVYLITGGAGGIGLEIAKHLASVKGVKLALLGRSEIAPKEDWDRILERDDNTSLRSKILGIRSVENLGAYVDYIKADISDFEQTEKAVNDLREKYGRIRGVIHAAGVGSAEDVEKRSRKDFEEVLSPKVKGTWIIDRLTRNDELDFIVFFSSVATIFGAPGQSDYSAANAYMDTYGVYLKKNKKRALTINWTAWKDAGMAVRNGINIDTMFMALDTKTAVQKFDELIGKDTARVLVGRINYGSSLTKLMEGYPLRLSDSIMGKLKSSFAAKIKEKKQKDVISSGNEEQKDGKEKTDEENDIRSEVEKTITDICIELLGVNDLNVNDDFFDLGADSILLKQVFARLDKKYPGKLSVADLYQYSTVAEVAKCISDMEKEDNALKKAESRDGKDVEKKVDRLFDELGKGNMSTDDIIKNLIDL